MVRMTDAWCPGMPVRPSSARDRLRIILEGGVPDAPPHFELAFQIEQEMFGMNRSALEKQYAHAPQSLCKAMEDFEAELRIRLVEAFDWAAVDGAFYNPHVDRLKSITRMKCEVGNRALVYSFNDQGVYWMPSGENFLEFSIMLIEHPEELYKNARRKCDEAKLLVRQQVDHGADFIVINTDFAFNKGPFISPSHFRQFITPFLAELVAECHRCGVPVLLHSDGDMSRILDQVHSTSIDGYQSIDPQGGMDIRQVREYYPDWILMGNVPCNLLQDGDEEAIRNAVRYSFEHGGWGKRYIFSTSNCIFKGMPPQSYRIMFDEYRRLIEVFNSRLECTT